MRIRILESRAGIPPVGTVVEWPAPVARELTEAGLAEEVGPHARNRKPRRPRPMRMARAPSGRPMDEGDDNDAHS